VRPFSIVASLLLLALAGACATRDVFRLVHPPATRDDAFPGGYRLLTAAPLSDWAVSERFATRADCEQARQTATTTAIDQAEAVAGSNAKNDLSVRRAVHARCVRTARHETPGS
jgi:hypothetical protein